MKIITKYYDKNLKLRTLKPGIMLNSATIRFKRLRNKKDFPCCDFGGTCTNRAYAEVFPIMMKNSKKKGWSYLCKKHYYSEQKRLKWKLPACLTVQW